MYDVSKLKTATECRTVMERAKAQGENEVYQNAFKRYCELVGRDHEDPSDPLIRDFYETLAAYEQLLTEKNGKTTTAARTRQKLDRKGVHASIVEWAQAAGATPGFELLINAGLPQFTAEYLVVKHSGRFPKDVINSARERLAARGIHI